MKTLTFFLVLLFADGNSAVATHTPVNGARKDNCIGCSLDYFYANSSGTIMDPPSNIQLSASYGGSTSGGCEGGIPPCVPHPCTLTSGSGVSPNVLIVFGTGGPTYYLPTGVNGGSVGFDPGSRTHFNPSLQQMLCGARVYETFYSDAACTVAAFQVGFICKDLCPQQ